MKNSESEIIIDLSHQAKVEESIAKKHEIRIGDIEVPKNVADYRKLKYSRVIENKFRKG